MGPVSRAATIAYQREVTGTLRDIVQELQGLRELINNRLGGNALDHETFNHRFETVEGRVYALEREASAGKSAP